MADITLQNESAPTTILPFPQTKRALRRRNEGMGAAGICALLCFEIPAPANVELFQDHRPEPDVNRSPELAMFLALYSTLNCGQQNDVRNNLKRLCHNGDGPAARAALDFLEWGSRRRIEKAE